MPPSRIVPKKVEMTLIGVNGNAFVLLGTFARFAQEQGWTKEEIDKVCGAATGGDYDNLLRVLDAHVTGEANESQIESGLGDD